ncbi:MAG TPA: metallophosphoesterase [Bacilli bacterium]|nr:metallophosphoesterase [Bacilli bacterium]
MKKGKILLIVLIFIAVGLLLWARFISTTGLNIREYAVSKETLPDSFDGFKIVHFSDLHYGRTVDDEKLEDIVNKINLLKPDIVVFTGDLIDKDVTVTEETLEKVKEKLSDIDASIAKFAVKGNHDYSTNLFENIMTEAGFKILDNESDFIYYKSDTPIIISGLSSSIKTQPDYENLFTNLELTEEELATYYKILLVHEPDQILEVEDKNFDLVLAGHSHNGQVRIPFVGAVIKTEGAKTYYESYYKVNDTDLYISGGVGCSVLNFRFLNKPSFNFYRLYSE